MGNAKGVAIDWNKVEYYMRSKGMSQRKLAAALGASPDRPLSEQTIRNWKKGTKLPNVKNFAKLAEILDVDPRDIMSAHYVPPKDSLYDEHLQEAYHFLDELEIPLELFTFAGYNCVNKYLEDWPGRREGKSAHDYLKNIIDKIRAREYTQEVTDKVQPDVDHSDSWRQISAKNDFYLDAALPNDRKLIYEIEQPDGSTICASADNLRMLSDLIYDAIVSCFNNAAVNLRTPPPEASIYGD